MNRNRIAVLVATLAVAIVPAVSASGASAATVEVRKTIAGEVLTDSAGFTLYMFTADKHKMDNCILKSGCTSVWPPLFAEGEPTAGPGVNPLKLKTIELPGGSHQVTYKNKPLYNYIGDKNPEETSYMGALAFEGYWFGLTPEGHKVGKKHL